MSKRAPPTRLTATPAPQDLAALSLNRQKADFPDLDVEGVKLRLAVAAFMAEASAIFEQLYAPMGSHVRFTIVNGLATLPELRLTPKAIAELLDIRSATLAPILAGLEREGWIARHPHESDKRSHYIVLAPGAAARWHAVMRDHVARTAPAGKGMSVKRYGELRQALDEVLKQLRRLTSPE